MRIKHGMFVVVEGVDGCGKSTTISSLMKLANRYHIANTYAKETTKTSLGRCIRRTVLDPQINLTKSEQTTAFAMARLECLKQITIPALLHDKLVIGDRYILSSLAYQANLYQTVDSLGLWHYHDLTNVKGMNKTVLGSDWIEPTFYVYIDLNLRDNVRRLKRRTWKQDSFDQDLENPIKMNYLKSNYRIAMKKVSVPILYINGNWPKKKRGRVIFNHIWALIMRNHLKTYWKH